MGMVVHGPESCPCLLEAEGHTEVYRGLREQNQACSKASLPLSSFSLLEGAY